MAIALIGALVVPATGAAGPGAPEYGGRVEGDPNHYIGFDVTGRGDNRRIRNLFLIGAPVACVGDPSMNRESGPVTDAVVRVRDNGKFRKTIRGSSDPSFRMKLAGRLQGNRATGTYSFSFRNPSRCYTATFKWRAPKPALPQPSLRRGGSL